MTDRAIRALKPAAPGKREMIWDVAAPSFGVRVSDKGAATFVVMRRVKGGPLVRRTIGVSWKVPLPKGIDELPVPLAKAREEAREIVFEMSRGVDVQARRTEEKRTAESEAKRRVRTKFSIVAEEFIGAHVMNLRSAANVSSAIRQKLVPAWGDRPIGEITRSDVIRIIREDAVKHSQAAYHLLAYCKKLFAWAVAQDCYGLAASPCDRSVTAAGLIGKRDPRQRILSDGELREIWHASLRLGYPFGDLTRLLLITGQRLREVANAQWQEFDLDKALWTIPASRMKGGIAHEVPLAPAALDMLRSLPRGVGPFLFSTTSGQRPVSGFSKAKGRLDRRLGDTEPWTFHDLRRTMRTGLGALPIPTNVAELVIAHAQPGLHKVYDLHTHRDEKRRALELWAARLLSIVEPGETSNVISIAARG